MEPIRISAIILAGLCFFGVVSCSSDEDAKKSTSAVPVKTERVRSQDITQNIQAVGNVAASASVNLVPRVTGEIIAAHFQEGQNVEEGQILVQLDPRPYQAALAEKKANLAKDQAQLAKARDDQRRYGKLAAGGYVSQESFQRIITDAAAIRATVQADQAAVESAALDLEYCSIKAPINGRVGKLYVDKGNMVSGNSAEAIARIDAISPAYVVFSMPEIYLPQIMANMRKEAIRLTAQAPGGEAETGELTLLDNSVDSATGTIELRGVFANQRQNLWPGQFVNVSLPLGRFQNALLLPTRAIQPGRETDQVYIVDEEEKARPVKVKPLFETGDTTVVEGDIQPGQEVIVEGQVRVAPGVKVKRLD